MKSMKWKLFIIWLSFKWVFRVNLGDEVLYRGKKYIVHNGVRYGKWRLSDELPDDGWVNRSECRKVWTLKNMRRSFRAGYRFYMTSWYDIWKREGIKPWMKNCNIW